jgi:hypothetical protein
VKNEEEEDVVGTRWKIIIIIRRRRGRRRRRMGDPAQAYVAHEGPCTGARGVIASKDTTTRTACVWPNTNRRSI